MKIKKLIANVVLLMLTISSLFARPDFNSYEEWCEMRHVDTPRFNETFRYIAKRDTKSLLYNHVDGKKEVPIKANEEVTVKCNPLSGKGVLLQESKYGFLACKDDKQFVWSIKDFALKGKSWIPNNITDNKWVMKYHYDVLKSKDRDTLRKYEWWIDIFDEKLSEYFYVDNGGDSASVKSWWQECFLNPEILITDCCIYIQGFFHFYFSEGYVTDKNTNKLTVKWYCAPYERNFNECFDTIMDGKESIIEYYLDGDYLTIYIDGNKIELAKKCDDFDTQWESLIQDDYCSLDNIIWPHHADGTSEYEDTIRYPEPVVIEEPEEIEIEEYKEPEKKEIPPFPDEKDPNYLEIIKEYYPNIYEDQLEHFEYLNTMKKIKILVISITSVIIMLLLLFIIIKNKRKSNKL